jgi:hypothetical protein
MIDAFSLFLGLELVVSDGRKDTPWAVWTMFYWGS